MKLANTERHIGHTRVVLTRRGEIVFGTLLLIGIAIAFLAGLALLDYLTTPEVCRVPFEQMSQGCIDLLYP